MLVVSYCDSPDTVRHVLRTCRESCEHIEDQTGICPLDTFLRNYAQGYRSERKVRGSRRSVLWWARPSRPRGPWTIRPKFAKILWQRIDTVRCISACPTNVDSTIDRLDPSHRSRALVTLRSRSSASFGIGTTFEEVLAIHVHFCLCNFAVACNVCRDQRLRYR